MTPIELDCGDAYAAEILFEEITERLQRGEGLTLKARQPSALHSRSVEEPKE